MQAITRRRFMAISAVGLALPGRAMAAPVYQWRGIALGAEASILVQHPQAEAIVARAVAEVARLEAVFSLYHDSSLMQLNRVGRLDAPPFELLECLALCGQLHAATGGRFDPTVQPLWALYAEKFSAGVAPGEADIAAVLPVVGWDGVAFDSAAVSLRPGAALTLNGVAQGWIADRIASMLRDQGLVDVLVNMGEMRALEGRSWPVQIATGGEVDLVGRGLASSAALGTVFDAAGKVGHILDPRTGLPAAAMWRGVTVSAASAAVADGLSTAACLMASRAEIEAALAGFDGARLEALV